MLVYVNNMFCQPQIMYKFHKLKVVSITSHTHTHSHTNLSTLMNESCHNITTRFLFYVY